MTYPLTTTLNRVWAHNPYPGFQQRALEAAGRDAPDDEPITYAAIIDAVGLYDALWCIRAEPQYSLEWRLFAVWCARQVQHLMPDQRSIDALDVAERFANGEATDGELVAAENAAWAAAMPAARVAARAAAWATAWADAWTAARGAAGDATRDAAWDATRAAAWDATRDAAWAAAWAAAWGATQDAVWAAARAARAAAGDVAKATAEDAQRRAFIQLVSTGELP